MCRLPAALFLALLVCSTTSNAFDLFSWFKGGDTKKREATPAAAVSEDSAKKYLQNFGYVSSSKLSGSLPSGSDDLAGDIQDTLSAAVRKFQDFAGLSQTGKLDVTTRKKMAEPRCGVTDVLALSTSRDDVFKWKKNKLTYSIFTYSPDLPHDQIKKAIRQAFDTWSAAVPLDFTELSGNDDSADIKVKFASGSHGDPWPFDGRGGVLAHATMPTSGLLHFDEDENWVYMDADKIASYKYTDLLPVAIHESGHVLGLEHTRTKDSIMAPFYQETVDANGKYVMPVLHPIDLQNIQDIYGPRRGGFRPSGGSSSAGDSTPSRTTTARPSATTTTSKSNGGGNVDRDPNRTPKLPTAGGKPSSGGGGGTAPNVGDTTISGADKCPTTVDAVAEAPGSATFLFSGSRIYEMHSGTVTRVHSLRLLFPNGPIYVEAAYFNTRSQVMVLFQSYNVFVFDFVAGRFTLDSSYPKRIPQDVGFNPTGALTWVDGSHLLLSRGDEFAVYDEYWNRVTKTDKISRYFKGMPVGVRGGLAERSGGTMNLFTQTKVTQYDATKKAQVGSGRELRQFIGCK